MSKRNIKILGAGPAGLTSAINLAKAGYDVEVFEKRSDTGKRFHGDVQGIENWSEKVDALEECRQMNLDINFDYEPLDQQIVTNGVKQRHAYYDEPMAYLVKRGTVAGSLDQALKAQALEAGVQIHFKQTLLEEEVDIVATGTISKEIFAVDKGIVFHSNYPEDLAIFMANDQAAYKGYAYLFIQNGYGCLCTVLFDKFKQLDACYQETQRIFSEMIDFDIQDPTPVSGVGCFSTKNIFQKGNTLYVGEAAGLQDLFLGFGIRPAFVSGYTAAQCLITGTDYPSTVRKLLDGRAKATVVARFLFEISRFNNYAVMMRSNNSQKSLKIHSLYDFDGMKRFLYPIARLAMKRRYPHLRL